MTVDALDPRLDRRSPGDGVLGNLKVAARGVALLGEPVKAGAATLPLPLRLRDRAASGGSSRRRTSCCLRSTCQLFSFNVRAPNAYASTSRNPPATSCR